VSYQSVELFDSRQISAGTDSKTILLKWLIYGGDDASEVDAYNFAFDPSGNNQGLAPYTMDGLNRSDCKLKNIAGPGGIWLVDVVYGSQPIIACVDQINTFTQYGGLSTARGPEYQNDTTGKTLHITQSLATAYLISGSGGDVIASGTDIEITGTSQVTIGSGAASVGDTIVIGPGQGWNPGVYEVTAVSGGGTVLTLAGYPGDVGTDGGSFTIYSANVTTDGGSAPSLNQAIGVTLDGVAGCDILVATEEFTISGVIAPFDMSIKQLWKSLVGTINEAPFWGYGVGEVLYQGATIQTTDGKQFRITHKFAAQPSVYNLVITDTIIIPYKQGWSYIWVSYSPGSAGSGSTIRPTQIPIAAYVEQVYPYGDFTVLGLG
jgi:hypothetical protein